MYTGTEYGVLRMEYGVRSKEYSIEIDIDMRFVVTGITRKGNETRFPMRYDKIRSTSILQYILRRIEQRIIIEASG